MTCSVPLSWTARTVTLDGDPCLTAFVSASQATKYAAASTPRRALAARFDVDGDRRGPREVAQGGGEPLVEPSRSNAGCDLTEVGDGRAHLGDDLVERG